MKKKIGQIVTENSQRQQDQATISDLLSSEVKRYWEHVLPYLDHGKKIYPKDFYIEVNLKKERLMPDVLPRILPITRFSCPTPNHDQDVYFYNKQDDALELVWSIPSVDACAYLKNNMAELKGEDINTLGIVLDFENGNYLKLAMQLNGEI